MAAPGPAIRLGVLVPSSNTNAESSIARMLAARTDVAAHFTRFALPPSLGDRIDVDVLGGAPQLLADAEPDAVAFHGTSGSWTGFAGDRALVDQLTAVTGAPGTTATLALRTALEELGLCRVGLVFPGPKDIAERIAVQYGADGVEIARIATPDEVLSNVEFARVDADWIDGLIRAAASADLDGVMVVGTNLRAAYRVAPLEEELGLTIVDSATATLWTLLRLSGADARIPGWGRLLATP